MSHAQQPLHLHYQQYVRSLTRDIISEHPVVDLWERREAVGAEIAAKINEAFHEENAYVDNLQLLNLEIPHLIQNAIEVLSTLCLELYVAVCTELI